MAILPGGNPESWNLDNVNELILNVLNLAMSVAGAVAVIFLIIGGFNYLTAFGNEEKASQGKKTVTWAIVGIAVIVLSKLIISWAWNFITDQPLGFPI